MIIDRYSHRTASELKQDEQALAAVLTEAGGVVKGRTVRCPFCDDKNPSAGIYDRNGDGYGYKCHACSFCGSILDVIAKVDGIEVAEVLKRLRNNTVKHKPAPKLYADIDALKRACPGEVEAVYQYTDPTTSKAEMIVIRCNTADGKTFRQASPQAGGYVMQAPPKPWPLYNRGRIQIADTVVVVEGEKCVHALHDYAIIATTSPAGAEKAIHADWKPLSGKNVILWPDNDNVGKSHMRQVETMLNALEPVPRIAIIEPEELDLAEKEDAADYVKQIETLHADKNKTQAAILEALNKAKPKGLASGVGDMIEEIIAGQRKAVKWTWPCIGGLTKALLPGTVTILCGNPGASKSFMLLEAVAYWHEKGYKTAIFELEEDRDFHLTRHLAQRSKTSTMTDPDWIEENPVQARSIFTENREFLDSFGVHIFASPETQLTLEQLAEWAMDRAKANCRIIAIDPITAAAHKRRDSWEEDNAFLQNIKRTATDYLCSIILVTHPTKTGNIPDMTQLAGGAAYSRFAQTILWLESHNEKIGKVKTACGTIEQQHNRTLHILKARNGKGQGVKLACNFQTESLTLQELGIIVKDKNTQ